MGWRFIPQRPIFMLLFYHYYRNEITEICYREQIGQKIQKIKKGDLLNR